MFSWDLHVHNKSRERRSIDMKELAKNVDKSGLDGVLLVDKVFTNEESFKNTPPDKLHGMREEFDDMVSDDVTIVHGYELRCDEGDIILVGSVCDKVEEYLRKSLPPSSASYWLESLDRNSACIIPHPFFPLTSVGEDFLEKRFRQYHGVETFNASNSPLLDPLPGVNRKARSFWEGNKSRISGTCGTDNANNSVGKGYCLSSQRITCEEELVKTLRGAYFKPVQKVHAHIMDNLDSSVKMIAGIIMDTLE